MKIRLCEAPEIKDNEDISLDDDIEIFEWAVSNGDDIQAGAKLVEVMVGKTSIEVAAPVSGKVTIMAEAGEIVTGDAEVAEIA